MKVFEFDLETGKRGKFIRDAGPCHCFGGNHPDKGAEWRIGRYTYTHYFGHRPVYHAGDIGQSFGTDAVCFCHPGMGTNTWNWYFCTDRGAP